MHTKINSKKANHNHPLEKVTYSHTVRIIMKYTFNIVLLVYKIVQALWESCKMYYGIEH